MVARVKWRKYLHTWYREETMGLTKTLSFGPHGALHVQRPQWKTQEMILHAPHVAVGECGPSTGGVSASREPIPKLFAILSDQLKGTLHFRGCSCLHYEVLRPKNYKQNPSSLHSGVAFHLRGNFNCGAGAKVLIGCRICSMVGAGRPRRINWGLSKLPKAWERRLGDKKPLSH